MIHDLLHLFGQPYYGDEQREYEPMDEIPAEQPMDEVPAEQPIEPVMVEAPLEANAEYSENFS